MPGTLRRRRRQTPHIPADWSRGVPVTRPYFGLHSRASFLASDIWAGVLSSATKYFQTKVKSGQGRSRDHYPMNGFSALQRALARWSTLGDGRELVTVYTHSSEDLGSDLLHSDHPLQCVQSLGLALLSSSMAVPLGGRLFVPRDAFAKAVQVAQVVLAPA